MSKYRSGDLLTTGHPLRENQTSVPSICLVFIDRANPFLTVAEGTFSSPVDIEQDGDFGPQATRWRKTAILCLRIVRGGLAGDRRILFAPEAICRLKQSKNQRYFES